MTTMDLPPSFDAFLDAAWADHGDHPDAVAQRLSGSLSVIGSAAQIAPYARLVAHVYGEHLGRFDEGIALLESMRSLACYDVGVVDAMLQRNVAVLRFA